MSSSAFAKEILVSPKITTYTLIITLLHAITVVALEMVERDILLCDCSCTFSYTLKF